MDVLNNGRKAGKTEVETKWLVFLRFFFYTSKNNKINENPEDEERWIYLCIN